MARKDARTSTPKGRDATEDKRPGPALHVRDVVVSAGVSGGKPWRLHVVTFSNGLEAATFSTRVACEAMGAKHLDYPVHIVTVPGRIKDGHAMIDHLYIGDVPLPDHKPPF